MGNIIYFDVCAVLVLTVMMLSAVLKHGGEFRTNRIFLFLLCLELITTIGSLGSAILENGWIKGQSVVTWTYVFNYMFFSGNSFVMAYFVLYIYATMDIWQVFYKSVFKQVALNVLLVGTQIVIFSNIWVKWVFRVDDNAIYYRENGLVVLHITAAILSIWGLCTVIRYFKYVERVKSIALLIIFPIIYGAILVQLLVSNVLLECFGTVLCMFLFMLLVQRNEDPVDPSTGAMRYHRAVERSKNAVRLGKPFSAICIKIKNYNNISMFLGRERYSVFLNRTSEKINSAVTNQVGSDLYYLNNGLYTLLSEETDDSRVRFAAEEIRSRLAEVILIDDLEVVTEALVCTIRYPEDTDDFNTLYTFATTFHQSVPDMHRLVEYSHFRDDKNFKIDNEINDIIRRGLDEHRFEMYYQPIYSTKENRFVCAEALLRLRDEKYGYIPPSKFIPAAEASGAIHEIGDFVLNDTLRFISENDMDALGLKYIEINLSASQCIEVDLVDKTLRALREKDVDASRISMELSETAVDINPVIVDQNVMRLHEAGIRLALDDYGTGYSNIRRLTSLPFDEVKLDRSFVEEISNPQMWTVIQSTIAMFKEMGIETLVEGIEEENVAKRFTEIQTDLLQGCELLQGFFFCRPLPEVEFGEYMKAHVGKSML